MVADLLPIVPKTEKKVNGSAPTSSNDPRTTPSGLAFKGTTLQRKETKLMKRIKTIETRNLCESAKNGGCGECQTSCQSACKTSCGVANQKCEK